MLDSTDYVPFTARVTSGAPMSGEFLYDWQEVVAEDASGATGLVPVAGRYGGTSGGSIFAPAVERNNRRIHSGDLPLHVQMQLRGVYLGQPLYEFSYVPGTNALLLGSGTTFESGSVIDIDNVELDFDDSTLNFSSGEINLGSGTTFNAYSGTYLNLYDSFLNLFSGSQLGVFGSGSAISLASGGGMGVFGSGSSINLYSGSTLGVYGSGSAIGVYGGGAVTLNSGTSLGANGAAITLASGSTLAVGAGGGVTLASGATLTLQSGALLSLNGQSFGGGGGGPTLAYFSGTATLGSGQVVYAVSGANGLIGVMSLRCRTSTPGLWFVGLRDFYGGSGAVIFSTSVSGETASPLLDVAFTATAPLAPPYKGIAIAPGPSSSGQSFQYDGYVSIVGGT